MKYIFSALLMFSIFWLGMPTAQAQSLPPIIRDTEIENTLKNWSAPLIKAAGLGPDSVNIILVQSPDINAFVAGGANIFIYTGLIEKTSTPEELMGVIAHELGHIAGGHLIKGRQAMKRASYESILGTIIGVSAAVIGGNGAAGSAIGAGSQAMAMNRYLSFSRTQESSADQAALHYMETAEINPSGLASFMEKIGENEIVLDSANSEYSRTHPLSRSRIDAMAEKIRQSRNAQSPTPSAVLEAHARMKAKLTAFISPGRVAWVYDETNPAADARYARAVAAYRQNNTDKALSLIDGLIAEEPKNPYFQEVKGQMLRDFGRVKDSLPFYEKATTLLPHAGLIRIDYGQALLAAGEDNAAIAQLERALRDEPRAARAHRFLATAYGHLGQDGKAQLHLAEEALLQRQLPQAKQQAQLALLSLEKSGQNTVRARDILKDIENAESEKQKN